eukprot:8525602-Pyramimonas_sp.AAC.1
MPWASAGPRTTSSARAARTQSARSHARSAIARSVPRSGRCLAERRARRLWGPHIQGLQGPALRIPDPER